MVAEIATAIIMGNPDLYPVLPWTCIAIQIASLVVGYT
jgi:hypothetical protein